MSSPFSSSSGRVVPTWTAQSVPAGTFVTYNPFGTFTLDFGYGSGGYGEFPYGQGMLGEVTFSTEWTSVEPADNTFTTVYNVSTVVWTPA